MITVNGLRNSLWCVFAFMIVACASAPLPLERLTNAKNAVDSAERARAAQYAQPELEAARQKLAAAQAAADQHDAEAAARIADQADFAAQLAESTARANQQEQIATDMDASLRDLRSQALKRADARSTPPRT